MPKQYDEDCCRAYGTGRGNPSPEDDGLGVEL